MCRILQEDFTKEDYIKALKGEISPGESIKNGARFFGLKSDQFISGESKDVIYIKKYGGRIIYEFRLWDNIGFSQKQLTEESLEYRNYNNFLNSISPAEFNPSNPNN